MDSSSPTSDPFHGLDPNSLMAAAAMPTDDGGADTLPLSARDLPALEEIAAAFPDLEILALIGHGGMSAVFRARQPKLDRVVALKVLPKSLAATPGFPERFSREGRVLARLSHPHIVTVHDFGESRGFCYLIMEHVDGVNLRQAMRAGRFTPEQALNIVPPLCDALQFAHSQGVLHRDIKPENILLDAKGRVKIADFGIAKILGEDGGDSMLLTQSGARLGTAPYMAPEQIEKPATVDHRADIYSLGVVFYEMLTGELPLGRFAAPSEKAAVSGGMDEVVFRALAKERERRQQSAGEFKTQVADISAMPLPAQQALARRFQSFEYKSKRTLFGMPLLHVTSGVDPATGRKRAARGFFAFGDIAVGVVACGGYARGLVAFGGVAVGGLAMGGVSLGLLSWGALALGLLFAMGGLSFAPLSTGGVAVGWQAMGAIAVAWHGYGATVFAQHGMGGNVHAPHVLRAFSEMPAALHWLVVASRWTSMGAFLWLPLTLPAMLVPWWARRQVALVEDGEKGLVAQDKSARVFWLIPAALLLAGLVWWMLHAWMSSGQAGPSRLLVPGAVGCFGILQFALSLPLWLRLVPMNSFYGVRLPSTFVSKERWYDVNAVFGRHLFLWSLIIIGAGVAGFYQLPRHQDAYAWAALTLIMAGVAASVVSTLVWMRRHPVGRPVIKPHRLVRNIELVMPVVVLMFFIRAFICAVYSIPHGNEPGLAQGSRWIASRLDTGFAPGDVICYAHENGQTWIARVVAVEKKGLLLKRGSSPEDFFMPWDKVVGKMLFSHFSPAATKRADALDTAPPSPPAEGTARALNKPVALRFCRIALNRQSFKEPVYTPEGRPVPVAEYASLIAKSSSIEVSNQKDDTCWLQLWFEHPDFDRCSELAVEITDVNGAEIKNRAHETGRTVYVSDRPAPPLLAFVVSPGPRGGLPPAVRLVLRHSLGPWQKGTDWPTDFHGSLSLGNQCLLAAFGEGRGGRAFVSWSKAAADDMVYDVVAVLKSGQELGSVGRISSSSGGTRVERVEFPASLQEIASFYVRSRKMRIVTFDKVVVPPLP